MKQLSTDDIRNEYSELISNFEKFNKALLEQITKILDSANISLGFPIQSRIKSIDSIIEKVESGRFNIKRNIIELQDIVGFRIILTFKKDVDKVIRLIEENFDVENLYDTQAKLLDNQFGYLSQHCIIKIPSSWCNVPTFKGLESYIAEIQVRSLSQHIWAEASNQLQYKNENNVPRELLRSISRVSALLETVDFEFDRLLKDRDSYINQINNSNDNQPLNVDLLKSILDEYLPEQNKDLNENYSKLIEDLKLFNIYNKNELVELINKYIDEVLKLDKKAAKDLYIKNVGRSEFYFYTHAGLIRTMLRIINPTLWNKVFKPFINGTKN